METHIPTPLRGSSKVASNRVSLFILSAFVALLPFFFIPGGLVGLSSSKGLLLFVSVALLTIFWILKVLKEGHIEMPRSWLLTALVALGVVYFVSALFSSHLGLAFAGEGFGVDTVMSIFAGILVVLLVPAITRSHKDLFRLGVCVVGGFVVVALVQLVHIISGPGSLGLSLLSTPIDNLFGGWNDLGIFAGLSVVFSMFAIEFLTLKTKIRALLYALIVFSLIFVTLVGFSAVWYVIGILSLVLLVHQLSFSTTGDTKRRRISPLILVILLLSLFFIFAGGMIGDAVNGYFGLGQVEVRPSWNATSEVALDVLKDGSVLGVGPNHFSQAWFLHKPSGVNQTAFWSVPFSLGIGYVPTSAVTTGVLGLVAWLSFLISLLMLGFRSLFRSNQSTLSRYLSTSSFFSAVYLWIFLVIYTPGFVIFTLAFVFTGIFLATLYLDRAIKRYHFSFSQNPTSNFVGALAGIVMLIVVGAGGYIAVTRFAGEVFLQRGVQLAQAGDINGAERSISNAVRTSEQARFYSTLTDVQTIRLNALLQRDDIAPDILREQFQTALSTTISNAQRGTAIGGEDHRRWMTLAGIYEDLVPFGIEGAQESSVDAYEQAQVYNPNGPDIMLARARLESRVGNNERAREFIGEALKLKRNYTDAVFLLSQIEISEGNVEQAITSVSAATILEPNNEVIFFQLGLLKYSTEDYVGAVSAFERAVLLNQVYANAKYFLGLSYYELGRPNDSIGQFEDILLLNPDSTEVTFILDNLKSGNEPFANVAPPLDDTPELRAQPPAEEPVVEG